MKTIVSEVYSLDCRHRTSFLICVIFVVVFPTVVSINAQKSEHENAYSRKPEDNPEFEKNSKESKVSSGRNENKDSMTKAGEDHRSRQSTKASEENSPALEKFLADVLKAQSDFKWIDQTVRNTNREKNWEKSNHPGNKLRGKRDFDPNRESIWRTSENLYRDANLLGVPRKVHSNNDVAFKRDIDFDDLDVLQNGASRKQIHPSPFYDKGSGDQIPKEWTKTKDICSLDDWLSSDKNSETEHYTSGDRWPMDDHKSNEKTSSDSLDLKEGNANADAGLNVRNERDEKQKKERAPTLESLKETILELKKSLNEADKKQRQENSKSVDVAKVDGKEDNKEEQRGWRTRARSKHEKNEYDDEASAGLWERTPGAERLDLKKREQGGTKDLDEKNAHQKVWRTKRTEVNNDDGNPKLFRRAGFGEPYLEENTLKELHDRKRRSKGTPSDEKHRLDEPGDKNNLDTAEENSKATSCNDVISSRGKESDDSRQKNRLTNDPEGAAVSKTSDIRKGENKNMEAGNYEQSDISRENLNAMENNNLTRNEEKGESLEGNSLRTFESTANELQTASSTKASSRESREEAAREVRMQKTEENQENVGSGKGEQVIKVFEPQGRLYRNGERTKEVRRTEADKEPGKLSREKSSAKDAGHINILVKSENKNLIKLSNAGGNENSLTGERPPFAFNMFDAKKKLILENEEKPGRSVSTVFNVKIEKAEIDTPVKATNEREENQSNGNGLFDFGRSKAKEVPYEDTPGSTNNAKVSNADEKRLKNSAELDKGLEQSRVNEKGIQNWLEGAVRNQMGLNVDQRAAEKCNEFDERDSDDKGKADFAQDSNSKAKSSDANQEGNGEGRNKKKYHEIFIMTNGMDDRVNDRYGQRRILQYMEYSNDDVEDADSNYNDKEEEDNQRDATADKSESSARRKERSAYSDKKKAKVNLLIKEKLDKKKDPTRGRKRRNPSVIEYYDYDADSEQQDHESLSPTSEQERSKNNYQDKNAVESDAGLGGNEASSDTCMPPVNRKTEYEESIIKERKQKERLTNKVPKQQFLSPAADLRNQTTTNKKDKSTSVPSEKVKLVEEEGTSGSQQAGSRINQPMEGNEDKFLDSDEKEMVLDPEKYILKVDKSLDPETIDDIFEDVQSMDDKKGKVPNSMEPLYEELKKIYDWSEEGTKSKPRVKGDQRMYYGANDKLDPRNGNGESFEDQIQVPGIHGPSESSGKSEIGERTYSGVSSDQLESPAASNVSQSNYFALKSTDDMFKGGPEQSNSTEEKLRGPSAIGSGATTAAAAQWRTQKVSVVRNGARTVPEKDAEGWSLTDQRQYIDTDSRSPYENRKYLQAQLSGEREHVQNIEREKQTVINSRDLHESFVEPLEWIDDFDDADIRVRLSRSLKTVETNAITYADSNGTKLEGKLADASSETDQTVDSTNSNFEKSNVALITQPLADLQHLLERNARLKRDAACSDDTLYDEINRQHRDSEKMDYTRYSKNEEKMNNGLQLVNSYEDMDNEKLSKRKLEEYDFLEDGEDDYDKVETRSASHKKKKKRTGKKKGLKKRKMAHRGGKSSKSRRKRRHHKKHDSKTKNHNKKRKKSSSKSARHHTNVKKSKASQNEEKIRNERKEQKVKKEDTNQTHDTRRRISSLLTADNMEDESQMDSALHGELAGKIVEQIFDQVQKNDALKVSLGPGLYQKHKTRDTVAADKTYRQAINDDEIKHTQELLNKIMLLLNRLIFDEVQRKTCISLPPDMMDFLAWMLNVNPQDNLIEQPPTLPLINGGESQDLFPQDKFLFQSFPNKDMQGEIVELYGKIQLIKNLIREYNTLTDKDKEKIESIQDYLAKQLDLLLEYIEAEEDAEKTGKSPSPRVGSNGKGGTILQYQIGTGNTSNGNYSTSPDSFSRLTNKPSLLTLSNANFPTDEDLFRESKPHRIDVAHKGQRTIRSVDKHAKHNKKKQRKRKKRKKKHGKRNKGASTIDQSPHKATVHKASALRQKREYSDQLFWDSPDAGYEEPLIYNSMDLTNVESNGNDGGTLGKEETAEEEAGVKENAEWRNEKKSSDLKNDHAIHAGNGTIAEEKFSVEEEPITGKSQVEDEILLLNKRQAWKKENEQQLEEVAFGEDMRKASKDKELFEKLTEIDKKKSEANVTRPRSSGTTIRTVNDRSSGFAISDEDKLRMLEEKINVYADNE